MAISKRLRYEILKRDGYTCRYCGGRSPKVHLTIGHVVASTLGGGDEPTNLVTACWDCNSGKSSTTVDADVVQEVSADAKRWADARAVAVEILQAEYVAGEAHVQAFDDIWPEYLWRPDDWESTVRGYFARGLPIELLVEATKLASTLGRLDDYGRYRYFCGVCNKQLQRLDQLTENIVSEARNEP